MNNLKDNYKFTPNLLRKRYATALGLIAILIIVSQLLIQLALYENSDSSRVINIAGRQRMLSQKITKSALALSMNSKDIDKPKYLLELTETLDLWSMSDKALKEGSAELEIKTNNSLKVSQMFSEIEIPFKLIIKNTNLIIENIDNHTIDITDFTNNILEQEPIFLKGMNQIVFQYDLEATNKLKKIKQLEIILLLITFILLFCEAFFIFVPVEKELKRTFKEIYIKEDYLASLASHDEMTGLYNKRVGKLLLEREFEKSKREETPFTVCFIDVDGLKIINDKYGHEAGDEYIKTVSDSISLGLRHSETAFRYGGDEFILLINGNITNAKIVIKRISSDITSKNTNKIKHSISCGYAELSKNIGSNAEDLLNIADIDMYKNKQKKKNNAISNKLSKDFI